MIMKKNYVGIAVMMILLLTGCGAVDADKSSDYDIETALEDNLTDADKKAKYIDYLEAIFENDIVEAYPAVKSAEVTLAE